MCIRDECASKIEPRDRVYVYSTFLLVLSSDKGDGGRRWLALGYLRTCQVTPRHICHIKFRSDMGGAC